ncbi:MAG: hypothetical protein WC748_05710 [Legionellales bacterium]|jgi:Fuc2NAc and GlcNAc transferase
MIYLLLTFVFTFIYTYVMVYLSNNYAKRYLMQAPHLRGTHTRSIPRGVGVAIVILCLIAICALSFGDVYFSNAFAHGLLLGGLLVAGIGFVDDHQHVDPKIRLVIQALAVGIVLYQIGGFPEFYILNHVFYLGWLGHILAFFGMIWLINLYNFIDGLDGQAGTETVFVSLNLVAMTYLLGFLSLSWLLFVLASSMVAFLCWNWQPAKVFMGDVCSGFLGFFFAALMAYTARDNMIPLISWLILLALPIADMSYTLIVRLLKGHAYDETHCTFAYHHAMVRLGSHQAVVLRTLMLNILWLAPFAWAAFLWPEYDLWFFLVAISLVFYIVIKLGAGKENDISKLRKA